MRVQSPRGTEDVLPNDIRRWRQLEDKFIRAANSFGYEEVRTPIFEDTSLFFRTAGETSDVVSKEMYTFTDKGGRSLTLKPELTAPTVRAVIEHSLVLPGQIGRLCYCGPIFRYGRPQMGRLRQAHQVGAELFGVSSFLAEFEIISLADDALKSFGIRNHEIRINSLGNQLCRNRFAESIISHLSSWISGLDSEARDKALKNPLRLLDSKDSSLINALSDLPPITNYLDKADKENLYALYELLKSRERNVRLDHSIVRGLDYYTSTVFEITHGHFGPSLAGGGRYDQLVEQLGGPSLPAVGFGIGIERALICQEIDKARRLPKLDKIAIFMLGDEYVRHADECAFLLRGLGARVSIDLHTGSLKNKFVRADKAGFRWVIVIGEDEVNEESFTIKNLRNRESTRIRRVDLESWWRGRSG